MPCNADRRRRIEEILKLAIRPVTDDAEDDGDETIVIDAESTNPALPLGGAMLLGLLLTLLGAVRMRMRDRTDIAHSGGQ